MTRDQILEAARTIVSGHREAEYGTPENNFSMIAKLWSAYMGCVTFLPTDVAMMMALLKIARIKTGKTEDSFVDLAGYAACGGECAATEEDENSRKEL